MHARRNSPASSGLIGATVLSRTERPSKFNDLLPDGRREFDEQTPELGDPQRNRDRRCGTEAGRRALLSPPLKIESDRPADKSCFRLRVPGIDQILEFLAFPLCEPDGDLF